MLGNFIYHNPTKLIFGKEALNSLVEELKPYGNRILLVYGGGSIKRNGIYDQIINILKDNNKIVFEDAGVMPNPTYKKLLEGIRIARENHIDFILAIGGGSVIDYSKALAASVNLDSDPWETYYERQEECSCTPIPLGDILTMVGTGSEMNGGAVITNTDKKLKIGKVFNTNLFPKFSILNPEFTYSVPQYQMIAGIYDAFNHICEQYFSDGDDCASDYIMEGLMRSLISSSRVAVKDPLNYEARSNIMWDATWALNTLVEKGKTTDWMVHMIGQAIGAVTNATHGMTLSAVSIAYYNYVLKFGIPQFKKFALNVWNVNPTNKTDEEIAKEGISCMKNWMEEIGLVMDVTTLGVTNENLEDIVNATIVFPSGFTSLTKDDVRKIIVNSMKK